MDSWFGKIREKLVIDKVTEEDIDSDEERQRKEEQMKDTLRKLNTDEMLNEDEIARASMSARKPIKDESVVIMKEEEKGQSSSLKETEQETVSQKPADEAEEVSESKTANLLESDEPYGSQFWD